MARAVYSTALGERIQKLFGDFELAPTAFRYVEDVLIRMAHARVLHLTFLANRQTILESVRTVHEYADRARNTYRRLMLALAEYRRPPRAADSFTAIRQANFAGQQVVMNGETPAHGNATNEQGSAERPASPSALSVDRKGAGITQAICGARPAVEPIHGAAVGRGQGKEPNERMEAR